jgi:type IV secretion system protein TrbE
MTSGKKIKALNEHTPWLYILSEKAIGINKAISCQKTWQIQPKDLSPSTVDDHDIVCAQLNNAIKRLDDGWAIFSDVHRRKLREYEESEYKNTASKIIEKERRSLFLGNDFYESQHFITLVYKPPFDRSKKLSRLFFNKSIKEKTPFTDHIKYFEKETQKIIDLLSNAFLSIHPLNQDETATYLHSCISKKNHPVKMSKDQLSLDFTDQVLHGGLYPKLGDSHLRIISVKGLPHETYPEILSVLNKIDFEFNWCTRFICLGQSEAIKQLKARSKAWSTKSQDIATIIKSIVFREYIMQEKVDSYSVNRSNECEEVLEAVNEEVVSIGYYTTTIAVWDEDPTKAQEKAQKVEGILNSRGFISVNETFNAVEAFLGSLPGNLVSNIRRALLTSMALSHMFPISLPWNGERT